MNRLNRTRTAIFIAVLVIAALTIHATIDHWRQNAEQKRQQHQLEIDKQVAAQKAAQEQEQLQKQREAAAQKAASDAAAATKKAAQEAADAAQKAAQEMATATQKAAKEAADAHAEFLARYTDTNFSRNPGIEMAAVAVASESGTMNHAIGAALVNRFKGERHDFSDSFFKPALVSDGLFNAAFNGSSDLFNKLELAKSLNAILLARQDVQYSTNTTLANIVTANMHLEIVALPIAGKIQSQDWKFMANGAGIGPAEAREQAEERIIKQINTDTNMSVFQIH
jgi:flagellar biosynthesis GTPase FlhF